MIQPLPRFLSVYPSPVIIKGTIGERELATQAILFNIESMCYTLVSILADLVLSSRNS